MSDHRTLTTALVAISTIVSAGGVIALGNDEPTPEIRSSAAVRTYDGATVGSSGLRRHDHAVHAGIRARFRPGHALTVWWVVFNEPTNCSAPGCGADDLFVGGDPANGPDLGRVGDTRAVVAYAGGQVAALGSGQVVLHDELRDDEAAGSRDIVIGEHPALVDAAGAEIHLVVRSHGPAVDGFVADQLGSYDGACTNHLLPPEPARAPGECVDTAFSVHLP